MGLTHPSHQNSPMNKNYIVILVSLSKSIGFTYLLMHMYIFTKECPRLVNMYSVTSQMSNVSM